MRLQIAERVTYLELELLFKADVGNGLTQKGKALAVLPFCYGASEAKKLAMLREPE
jgi:hypothetical protein